MTEQGTITAGTATSADQFVAAFEKFESRVAGSPSWLTPVRKAAIARLNELGFPNTKHEDWRSTNLAPLTRTTFVRATPPADRPSPEDLKSHLFAEAGCSRLVFVNGGFDSELSDVGSLPDGVVVGNMAEIMARDSSTLEPYLTRYADNKEAPFIALNTAFLEDGACVIIPPNTVIERPIHVLYVTVAGSDPIVVHPRTLFVLGESSEATLIENYAGINEGVYFSNPVTEIIVGPNAKVDHYRVQRESEKSFHIGWLQANLDRDSRFNSHSLAMGGGFIRNNVHAMLDGEGCDCTLNGLYVTHGEQHVDNHLRVEHAKPHCNSWEFYKGILDGHSSAVFTGRIYVHEEATKTDAKQSNMNLLLSDHAQIDTKPQLEIFTSDVRCTHGATIGQIDKEAMFYLQCRGVPKDAARSMLTYAFAGESLGQIKVEALRNEMQAVLLQRLPHGEMLQAGSPLFYGSKFSEHIKATDRRRESY